MCMLCMCVCVCMYVCMYVCVYVYMYVCVGAFERIKRQKRRADMVSEKKISEHAKLFGKNVYVYVCMCMCMCMCM